MFCPKCGHQQSTETMRFCSRCGLPLDGVGDLLASSDNRAQREKSEVIGISLILSTLMVLLIYFIVFGALALSKISDKSILTVWITFLSVALILGGAGIFNLIRSGFFTKLKERQIRVQLERLRKKERELESRNTGKIIEDKNILQLPEMPSITESTTRNLAEEARMPDRVGEKR
jgi:hypothetical protein